MQKSAGQAGKFDYLAPRNKGGAGFGDNASPPMPFLKGLGYLPLNRQKPVVTRVRPKRKVILGQVACKFNLKLAVPKVG
jgi:hypothetical protein